MIFFVSSSVSALSSDATTHAPEMSIQRMMNVLKDLAPWRLKSERCSLWRVG
jgi:hypothetical protein